MTTRDFTAPSLYRRLAHDAPAKHDATRTYETRAKETVDNDQEQLLSAALFSFDVGDRTRNTLRQETVDQDATSLSSYPIG